RAAAARLRSALGRPRRLVVEPELRTGFHRHSFDVEIGRGSGSASAAGNRAGVGAVRDSSALGQAVHDVAGAGSSPVREAAGIPGPGPPLRPAGQVPQRVPGSIFISYFDEISI